MNKQAAYKFSLSNIEASSEMKYSQIRSTKKHLPSLGQGLKMQGKFSKASGQFSMLEQQC